MLSRLKSQAERLQAEVYALYLAARDPRTPWYAKALVLLIVAYAVSPIDLIPDFVPVLGYLDDLLIIPAGIVLALALIPVEVMADARAKAASAQPGTRIGLVGAAVIVVLWILAIVFLAALVLRLSGKRI
jgi:uncharacterized membrane protein YkvA (DUF1232 family)